MDRSGVRRLLGIEAARTRIVDAEVSAPQRWEGILRSRVTLRAPDGHPIPCLLLEPEHRSTPLPVVAVHQHNGEFHLGKSEPAGMAGNPDMGYGLALAKAGVTTLIPDLHGFEERRDPAGDGARDERFHAWNLIAHGSTLQGAHVTDVCVAVDWILHHTGGGSCGVIGHSLGGQVGFFSMACDERIVAGVLNCGVGTVASFEAAGILHNPAWYPPGIATLGDSPAVARAFHQQRVLLVAGRDDPLFPIPGVDEVVAAFAPGIADHEFFDGGHELPPTMLTFEIDWLIRELNSASSPRGAHSLNIGRPLTPTSTIHGPMLAVHAFRAVAPTSPSSRCGVGTATVVAAAGRAGAVLGSGMVDHATPNLPSRHFAATVAFYERLGFAVAFQDSGWLILERSGLTLEFFPYPELDPATSSFGACLRLDDVDAFYAVCLNAGIPDTTVRWPRLHRPRLEASGLRIGALVDPDGSLLRLVQNPET